MPQRDRSLGPGPVTTPAGTFMLLGISDSLAADILEALDASNIPSSWSEFTEADVLALMREAQETQMLRADAGLRTAATLLLYTLREELNSGAASFLTCYAGPTPQGEGLFWIVSNARPADHLTGVTFAYASHAMDAMALLRAAGGGLKTPTQVHRYKAGGVAEDPD